MSVFSERFMGVVARRRSRVAASKRSRSIPIFLVVLAALSGCQDCDGDDVLPSTSDDILPSTSEAIAAPSQIRIVPPVVHAVAGQEFRLEVQVVSPGGVSLMNLPSIVWETSPGLTLVPSSQGTFWANFKVDVAPNVQPGDELLLEARSAQNLLSPGLGKIIVTSDSPPADAIAGQFPIPGASNASFSVISSMGIQSTSSDLTPSIGLVDGDAESGCINDYVVAFVGWGWLDDLTGDCTSQNSANSQGTAVEGSITFFSRNAAVQRLKVNWATAGHRVVTRSGSHAPADFASNTTLVLTAPAPIVVPLVVWQGVVSREHKDENDNAVTLPNSEFDDLVNQDIELANAVFRVNRAGIYLNLERTERLAMDYLAIPSAGNETLPLLVVLADNTHINACEMVHAAGELEDKPMDLNKIHVIYLFDGSGMRGFSCLNGGIVFIDTWSKIPLTFAHELAHQLGLRDPDDSSNGMQVGHTDDKTEILTNNLMRNVPAEGDAPRGRLTLGQVSRMSLDNPRSWLVRNNLSASSNVVECGEWYEDDVPCPKLYRSVHDAGSPALYP